LDWARNTTVAKGSKEVLFLLRQSLVHRQEHIELAGVGDEAEELAVADAGPPSLRHGFDPVAGEFTRQILGQTFVEQEAHSGSGEQAFAGLFEKGHGLLARNRGVLVQKRVERLATFEVIEQRPDGNTRARKARLAAHDFRVSHDNGLLRHIRH
jgi:hypothetical protein